MSHCTDQPRREREGEGGGKEGERRETREGGRESGTKETYMTGTIQGVWFGLVVGVAYSEKVGVDVGETERGHSRGCMKYPVWELQRAEVKHIHRS